MVRSISALLVVAIAVFAVAPVLAQDAPEAMTTVDIGSHKHLNNALGVVNKNNVIHSNNMAMTKSNLLLRQDDDVTLDLEAQRNQEAAIDVDIGAHKHLNDATALVNKNNVLHSNNMAMTKGNLRLSQNDDLTLDLEGQGDKEAAIAVDVGSHKHLNDATALINKNTVIHSNNLAMAKSNLLVRQDDDVTLELPEGVSLTEEAEPLADAQEQFPSNFRQRFSFRRGDRVVYGWRYSITYWNRFGRSRFARDCVFNRPFGDFFYC